MSLIEQRTDRGKQNSCVGVEGLSVCWLLTRCGRVPAWELGLLAGIGREDHTGDH